MRQRVEESCEPLKLSTRPLRPLGACTKNKCKNVPRGLLPRVNSAGFNEAYFQPFRDIGAACADPWTVSFSVARPLIEELDRYASLMPNILQRLNRSRRGRAMCVSGARLTSFQWIRSSCWLRSVSVVDGLFESTFLFVNALHSLWRSFNDISLTFYVDKPPHHIAMLYRTLFDDLLFDCRKWSVVNCVRNYGREQKYVYTLTLHCSELPNIGSMQRLINYFPGLLDLVFGDISLTRGCYLPEVDFTSSVPSDFCTSGVRRFSIFGRFFIDHRRKFKPVGRLCYR